VMDPIERLPQTGEKGIYLKQQLKDRLVLRSNSRSTRFWRFHDADYDLSGTNASEYS
jgi:hypothetical protein